MGELHPLQIGILVVAFATPVFGIVWLSWPRKRNKIPT